MAQSSILVISEASSTAFAQAVEAAFTRATADSGPHRVYCHLADATVCFELARAELRAMTRALAHLETGPAPPDLTVRVFDRTLLPRPPWDWAQLKSKGEVPVAEPAWRVSYLDDVLSLWRQGAPTAQVWLRDVGSLSMTQRGSPFLHLLHAFTRTRGWTLLHGAAAGGVLLVGPGGAGKSSCAQAAAKRGLPYLADDYCLVQGTALESLYCSAKLWQHDLPSQPDHCDDSGKGLLWMRPIRRAALRAVVVPEQTGDARASLQRVSAAYALRAVAPSTLFQLPWSGQETVGTLSDLVRRVPCYRLRLGAREDVPPLLESLS